jgi:hypothetical protein
MPGIASGGGAGFRFGSRSHVTTMIAGHETTPNLGPDRDQQWTDSHSVVGRRLYDRGGGSACCSSRLRLLSCSCYCDMTPTPVVMGSGTSTMQPISLTISTTRLPRKPRSTRVSSELRATRFSRSLPTNRARVAVGCPARSVRSSRPHSGIALSSRTIRDHAGEGTGGWRDMRNFSASRMACSPSPHRDPDDVPNGGCSPTHFSRDGPTQGVFRSWRIHDGGDRIGAALLNPS